MSNISVSVGQNLNYLSQEILHDRKSPRFYRNILMFISTTLGFICFILLLREGSVIKKYTHVHKQMKQ